MGKKADILEIKESLSQLKTLRNKQTSLQKEKRVLALIFLKDNKFEKRIDLARSLGITVRTLERWVLQYKENGIEDLLTTVPRKQGSKIITPEIHKGLEERVKAESNSLKGYWDAQQWVKEKYGVDVNYHTLRGHLMKHFKTKVKRPRKSHIKKDPEAREAFFKTTLYAKGGQN